MVTSPTPGTARDPDFKDVAPVEVAPGSPDDPFTDRPGEASGDASPPVGDPNAAAGAPQEPAQSPPVEGAPPTAAAPSEEGEPAAPTAPPAQPSASDEEGDEAALARLNEFVEGKLAAERQRVQDEEMPKLQSGMDRRINALTDQLANQVNTFGEERTQMTQQIRELEVKGLPEDQRLELERRWDWEDKQQGLDGREELLNKQHDDLEIMRLLMTYQDYEGVSEETLRAEAFEDREAFCLQAKAAHLESELTKAQQGNGTQTQPTTPTQAPAPEEKSPAGASAPSDVAGGPPAPEGQKFNTGQGPDAMRANVGTGWENLPVPAGPSRG